jgi:ABC-type lipoprotein release transport system permease subunit
MVTGIEPTTEDEVTRLREKVVSGEYLDDASQAVMVAEGLAERLKLQVNDTLVLLGQGYYGVMAAGKYPIAALLEFGSPDLNKRMVYMPIGLAQQWLGARDEATALVVLPRSPGRIEQLSASLNKRLPEGLAARTWMELMPDIVEFIRTDKAGGIIVLAILYVLISFGIFATLLMMFAERRRELGMLVALGMKKGQLALMILYESIFINLTGCIFGILVSIPIIWYLAEYPIRLGGDYAKAMEKFNFEPVLPASTDPGILITQALIVLVISSLLALYPIYKVLTMEPIKAMRA